VISMKKRINDLSILKSSNNAIMNQKIGNIVEENEKLKHQIEELKSKKKIIKE
jgi:cell division protein FtsB